MGSPGLPVASDVVARLRAAGCVWAQEEAELLLAAATSPAGTLDPAVLEPLLLRRISGEPLEQVLGWAAFAGLRLAVAPGVFVPRRRTEVLAARVVELAVARTGTASGPPLVLDLCCGVGALGAAVTAAVPGVVVWASDVDPAALACARTNLPAAELVVGDLFAGLPSGLRFDVIGMNAPYVPSASLETMPAEARLYEPVHTLDGGPDGLALHRRALAEADGWLSPGGALATECAQRQSEALAEAAVAAGFAVEITDDDDLDVSVVVATR